MTGVDMEPMRPRASSRRRRGVVVVAVLLTAASLLRLLTLDDAEATLDDVRSWGAWPWLVIVLLLWADLVLPVPQPSVIALAGVLYGVVAGALLGTLGLVLGGATGYWLARTPLHRRILRLLRTAEPKHLAVISQYAGPWGIALTRSLPYSVPEAVVIVAGLGRVRWKTVLAALVAGSAPVALLYAGIGAGWAGEPVVALVVSQVVPVATLPIALRWSTPSRARGHRERTDGRPNGRRTSPTTPGSSPTRSEPRPATMNARPDYGLDAPAFLFVASGLGGCLLVLGAVSRVTAWPGDGTLRHAVWPGLIALSYAALHLWVSKVGKLRRAARLLESLPWHGHERVLDVGCGRGLLLIGAAKRLTTGLAVGVDIWQQKDQWRNSPDNTLDNARRASVSDRVAVEHGDARALPFKDESFDVILSSAALHNIQNEQGRRQAVREIARVLKPGGQVRIVDLSGTKHYASELHAARFSDIHLTAARLLLLPMARAVSGTKPPRSARL